MMSTQSLLALAEYQRETGKKHGVVFKGGKYAGCRSEHRLISILVATIWELVSLFLYQKPRWPNESCGLCQ